MEYRAGEPCSLGVAFGARVDVVVRGVVAQLPWLVPQALKVALWDFAPKAEPQAEPQAV